MLHGEEALEVKYSPLCTIASSKNFIVADSYNETKEEGAGT